MRRGSGKGGGGVLKVRIQERLSMIGRNREEHNGEECSEGEKRRVREAGFVALVAAICVRRGEIQRGG